MLGIPQDLIIGDAEAVGVRYYQATPDHPPLRVFYPAVLANATSTRSIGWFDIETGGILQFLKGFLHTGIARHDTLLFQYLLVPVLYMITPFLPMTWLRVNGVYKNAPLCIPASSSHSKNDGDKKNKKLPVIIFSHGLTGTGQENTALCAAWAKQGFIVAALHHTDGSSCRVRLQDGTTKWYQHGPSFTNYDASFRPRQVQHRASEMLQAHGFLSSSSCPDFMHSVDMNRVVAAGFSFGAATAARAVTMKEDKLFCGALLLDGWFYVDVGKSAGIEFEFPKEAFEVDSRLAQLPRLFLNSEQFEGYPKLFGATQKLVGKEGGELHVISETSHQNFCDFVFWLPTFLMQRVGAIGAASPEIAYREIIALSSTFLKKVTQQ